MADEYHYLLTDATINKYIDFSYVTLNELTKYRPVIFTAGRLTAMNMVMAGCGNAARNINTSFRWMHSNR